MTLLHFGQIIILALIQGLAELLPVSSSAHVIVAEKLMGLKPSEPPQVLLLVMLHTGTMFAVIVYFWRAWKASIFASRAVFKQQAVRLAVATALTAAVAWPLKVGIEKGMEKFGWLTKDASGKVPKAEIELLFNHLGLIAGALAAVGILILIAGLIERRAARNRQIGLREAAWMGAVQGLCLPFRGFSRSGATISVGLLLGALKPRVEEFSFALAVILTPAVIGREVLRLIQDHLEKGFAVTWGDFAPSLLGMCLAFLAGLLAPAVAFPLAGGRPLVSLRRLLPAGRWSGLRVLHCRGY